MQYLKKVKDFIVKYWEIFVGALLLAVGFVWGTSGSREKVLKKDIKEQKKAADRIKEGTEDAIKKFDSAISDNKKEKSEREVAADQKEKERKEELLKDSSKLDKVLKEKYKLRGE